jgi:hypothetical protein
MGARKTAVAISVACVLACAESLLDWMCFSPAIGRLGKAFGYLDDVSWCIITPSSHCRSSEVASRLIFYIIFYKICE